jgi:Cys-tRNA(Pro)/Cys-tRNA(Cys) deacylase
MAKTLLLTIKNKEVFRVVIPGFARLNIDQLASILNVPTKKIRFANTKQITEAGFILGAIPPFGGDLLTCIDKSLLTQDILYCGAGENNKTFSLKPSDIVFLSSAITAGITNNPKKE